MKFSIIHCLVAPIGPLVVLISGQDKIVNFKFRRAITTSRTITSKKVELGEGLRSGGWN